MEFKDPDIQAWMPFGDLSPIRFPAILGPGPHSLFITAVCTSVNFPYGALNSAFMRYDGMGELAG